MNIALLRFAFFAHSLRWLDGVVEENFQKEEEFMKELEVRFGPEPQRPGMPPRPTSLSLKSNAGSAPTSPNKAVCRFVWLLVGCLSIYLFVCVCLSFDGDADMTDDEATQLPSMPCASSHSSHSYNCILSSSSYCCCCLLLSLCF